MRLKNLAFFIFGQIIFFLDFEFLLSISITKVEIIIEILALYFWLFLSPFQISQSFYNQIKNMQTQNTSNFQSFQVPPNYHNENVKSEFHNTYQKLYCVKCGTTKNTSIQTFNKKYVSPVSVLGIFFGILPYFLLRILLSTNYTVTAPFCITCWDKFKNVNNNSALIYFAGAMLILGGFFVSLFTNSMTILVGGFCLSIPVFIWGKIYSAEVSPKYKKVSQKQLIISAPIVGDIVYTK